MKDENGAVHFMKKYKDFSWRHHNTPIEKTRDDLNDVAHPFIKKVEGTSYFISR